MHDLDEDPPRKPRRAFQLWFLCCLAMLAPSLAVWAIRGGAYALHCNPGPQLCGGLTLGAWLRQALEIAWALPTNSLVLLAIAFTGAIAAVFARRFLLGALTLLVVPILASVLPMIAVLMSTYDNCPVNEGGVGDCPLWGANMGMAFHHAANVNDLVYGFAPYTFAAALMLGVLGWFVTRPKPRREVTAASMRMPERRPPDGGRLDQ